MLDNILYLADFSNLSEAALSFAIKATRTYDARVYALHVLIPSYDIYATSESVPLTIKNKEESVEVEIERIDLKLGGLRHEIIVKKNAEVWLSVEQAIRDFRIDLVVLGTRGRTDDQRVLLGSVAEETLRCSPVPALTIGSGVPRSAYDGPWFQRALVAMDFTPESTAALSYAVSLAEENQARLALLHVTRHPEQQEAERRFELSAAEAFHQLYESVPKSARLRFSPEVALEYGEPVERIIETAEKLAADLIVLGIRDPSKRLGAPKQPERKTARRVAAYAGCPVLTVRGKQDRIAVGTAPA